MYAVIQTGGKQYKVKSGDVVRVERLPLDVGQTHSFSEVLMVSEEGNVSVGKPFVDGAKVTAEVVSHGRGDKVRILKFKRRKHHMKRQGHRQGYTELKIDSISA